MFQHQIIASDRPEREEAYTYISDASKDAWGFRNRSPAPRYMSLPELYAECDYWSNQVARTIREEAERDALAEFEATIQHTIEAGAGNRETAFRWLWDAWVEVEGCGDRTMIDHYFNFCHDLPYDYDPRTGVRTPN